MKLQKYKPARKKWIAFFVMAAILAVLTVLKYIKPVSEYVFARGLFRAWVFVFGNISSLLPFSLFEGLIIVLVCYTLYCIVTWIICAAKKNGNKFNNSFACFCLTAISIFTIYCLAASPVYMREELKEVPFSSALSQKDAFLMAKWYCAELDTLSKKFERDEQTNQVISPYSFKELSDKLAEEYGRFDSGYLASYTPQLKPSLLTFMWKEFRIAGVTFIPLGEAVTHADILSVYSVLTMAHEMAHTKGAMRENDANLLSYFVTFDAKDDFIRYCGMSFFLSDLFFLTAQYPDGEKLVEELWDGISEGIIADLNAEQDYWPKEGIWSSISLFFNDLYLKLSGASDGTGSYGNHGGGTEPAQGGNNEPGEPPVTVQIYLDNISKMMIAVYQSRNSN